jgi:hypothetical protein
MKLLLDALSSPSAVKREMASLGTGFALLFVSWTVAYLLLPEGLLRGRTGASVAVRGMSDRSLWLLLAQILAWNGVVAFVLTFLASRVAVGRFSLAYLVGFGNAVLFGLYLGTNSMQYRHASVPAPSLSIFLGPGAWEIAAYLTVGAALARIYRTRQSSFWRFEGRGVESPGTLGAADWALLALGAVLLVAMAWFEAHRILRRG